MNLKHPPFLYILCFQTLFFSACQTNPFRQGQILYENYCANCHMSDGSGLESLIPPLAGADFLSRQRGQLPCIIRYGMKGEITVNGKTYNQEMTGIPELTDFEIANIINYIARSWNNQETYLTIREVQSALEKCE